MAGWLLGAALVACLASPLCADEPPAVAERLNVREVELVVEPPPTTKGLTDLRTKDLQPTTGEGANAKTKVDGLRGKGVEPGDLLLAEDGQMRPVLRLEPLAAGSPSPWRFLIYFDRVLARAETVHGAALALAEQAARLTELGTVEIVVADPLPHRLLERTREVVGLREALAGIAADASRDTRAHPVATTEALRRQCDRLVLDLVDSAAAGPHALLLVADAPAVSGDQLQLLASSTPEAAVNGGAKGAVGPALVLRETARMLAAYGWLTVALPVHRLTGNPEPVPEDDYTRFRRRTEETPRTAGASFPLFPLIYLLTQWLRGKPTLPAPDARLVAPQLAMENVPLMALVRPTAGGVVAAAGSLPPALDAIGARWHLWYQGDATPEGRERKVALSVLASAHEVRTFGWVRSSIPEPIAAARLRRALDGDAETGPRPIHAAVPEDAGASRWVQIRDAAPGAALDPAASGPFRLSFAWNDAAGSAVVVHQLLPPETAAAWLRQHQLRLPVPEPAAGRSRLAVVVEDLANETWGATVVELPPAPADATGSGAEKVGAL